MPFNASTDAGVADDCTPAGGTCAGACGEGKTLEPGYTCSSGVCCVPTAARPDAAAADAGGHCNGIACARGCACNASTDPSGGSCDCGDAGSADGDAGAATPCGVLTCGAGCLCVFAGSGECQCS